MLLEPAEVVRSPAGLCENANMLALGVLLKGQWIAALKAAGVWVCMFRRL